MYIYTGYPTIHGTQEQKLEEEEAAGRKSSQPLTGTVAGGAFLALLVLGIVFLSGCGFSAAQADVEPAAAPGPVQVEIQETAKPEAGESGYLAQALVQIPAERARRFAFTHWARVRSHNGFTGNSQETSRDERVAYMLNVMKQTQPAAQLDSVHFLFQEQNWGWDSTDLVWEAEIAWQASTESAHLLQFRADFDFTPLLQLLKNRGFTTTNYRGVPIYAVPLTETPEWHYRSNLAHHTMAFPGDGLVIMAPTPAALARVLYARDNAETSLAAQPQLAPLLPELGQMMAVELQFGAESCAVYGDSDAALSPYAMLAIGHRSDDAVQEDVLLLAYNDAVAAGADLAGRRELLQNGASGKRAAVYGDVFQLEEAAVEGRIQRFRLSPTEELRTARPGWPQTLLGWAQDGDAVFAGCGAAGEGSVGGIR